MIGKTQAGFTLLEVAVAAAVVAIAAGGALFAIAAFGRYAAHQAGPVRTAAANLAEETLRVAQDAWKYGSPGGAPAGSVVVNVPLALPGAAPTSAPVTVTTTLSNQTAAQAQITVSATYATDAAHPGDTGTVTVSGNAIVKAPLPGSRISDPQAVPAPSGAP